MESSRDLELSCQTRVCAIRALCASEGPGFPIVSLHRQTRGHVHPVVVLHRYRNRNFNLFQSWPSRASNVEECCLLDETEAVLSNSENFSNIRSTNNLRILRLLFKFIRHPSRISNITRIVLETEF